MRRFVLALTLCAIALAGCVIDYLYVSNADICAIASSMNNLGKGGSC